MNNLNEMDQDMLLNALLMSSATESDDDSDDEIYQDSDDDSDDEYWAGEDESWSGFGESDDEAAPRRGKGSFRGSRYRSRSAPRLRTVRGSKSTTLRAPNGQQMQVQFGKSYATTEEVNKLIKSTEAKFAAAMAERKANHAELTKQIASATKTIDSKIAAMDKKVKSLESKSQTLPLLSLLSGPPKAKKITIGNGQPQDATIEFESADITLPLLLGGGLGGSGSGDNNMLLLALMLGKK